MPRTILDVSRWQGRIDWDKVKASGLVSGVMIAPWATAKRANLANPTSTPSLPATMPSVPGWVSRWACTATSRPPPRHRPTGELALFKQALGGRKLQLPVAVDIEDTLQAALSKSALTDIVAHCLSVVENWGRVRHAVHRPELRAD